MSTAAPIGPPAALHVGDDDCPWVDSFMGFDLKVVQVRLSEGLWVVRNRFQPGTVIQKHRHTGPVYAFTLSGSWKYAEYPEVNRAGSFLYEPAGSEHTLTVPDTNAEVTDVWFAVWGANLNLDADGNVESVYDAPMILDGYRSLCQAAGLGEPRVLVAE
ncbi:MAG: 2,4'-dihydroxyacetophenone dioxygenase family protein [Microthrixaceae bacterium]